MTGTEIAIGKAFFDIFKWVYKEFPAKSIWSKFKYKTAAEDYAQKMKKRYGIMQLWKMSAPTSVEQIYTEVNILEKQSAFRHLPKAQLEKMILDEASFGESVEKAKDGMAVVREHNRLFVLGKPGAGKTTFLKHITFQGIKGAFDAIPIFVTLRELSESKETLIDFVNQQFDICGLPEAQPFIETILKQGKAIVLFDGLDEVNREGGYRDTVIQAIKDFSDKYDQSKVVITCRVAASEYNFEGFTYVEMADFGDAQIETFVAKWFAENQKICKLFFDVFKKQEGKRLRDLAKNPLLLTLLCIGFEESLHFPDRRSEIYGEALNALLQKRDSSRGIKRDTIYKKLSLGRKNQMFARIAAETFEKGEYLIEKKPLEKKIVEYLKNLPPGDAKEEIDGEAVLKAIEAQHGIFVERAKGLYSFAHLSFQEYYAAKYVAVGPESRLPRLIDYCNDFRWREVIFLATEMLDDADLFFKFFLKKLRELGMTNKKLTILLTKVEQESNQIGLESRVFDRRKIMVFGYLFPAGQIKFVRGFGYVSNLTIELAFPDEIDRIEELRFDQAKWFDALHTNRTRDLSINHSLAYYLSCAYSLSCRFGKFGHRKDVFVALQQHFCKASKLSEQIGLTGCGPGFSTLKIPSESTSAKEWTVFADELLETFKSTFRIEDYAFTEEGADQVADYLEATILLLDCLKVAYVSDRASIEEQLLRPPKN